MIPEHRPAVDYMAILSGAIARAAERLGLTPEDVALDAIEYLDTHEEADWGCVAACAEMVRERLRKAAKEPTP
jgi:hypothetical protein